MFERTGPFFCLPYVQFFTLLRKHYLVFIYNKGMKNFIFIFAILLHLKSWAQGRPEFVCWEQGQMPGFAFEALADDCGDGKVKMSGTVSDSEVAEKKVVCTMPAACIAVTPKVLALLKRNLGIDKTADLKRFNNFQIMGAFNNTEYMPKYSWLQCEGKGKLAKDSNGKLNLAEAKCPAINDCANGSQVFYAMSPIQPMTIPDSGRPADQVQEYPKVKR